MRKSDVIQSIRYMLDVNDHEITKMLTLADYNPKREEVANIFDDDSEKDASHELMAHFLDGLIYYRRGKSDKHPPQPIEIPVTNNIILKKLRVAFKLREGDILKILESAGFKVSKHELSALFRRKDHKNYRECGDQLLRYFLKGLTMKYRPDAE